MQSAKTTGSAKERTSAAEERIYQQVEDIALEEEKAFSDRAPSDFAPGTPSSSQQFESQEAPPLGDEEASSSAPEVCASDLSAAALLLFHQGPPEAQASCKGFVSGNYRNYYAVRKHNGDAEDPRLRVRPCIPTLSS